MNVGERIEDDGDMLDYLHNEYRRCILEWQLNSTESTRKQSARIKNIRRLREQVDLYIRIQQQRGIEFNQDLYETELLKCYERFVDRRNEEFAINKVVLLTTIAFLAVTVAGVFIEGLLM